MEVMKAVRAGAQNLCKILGFKLEDGARLGKNVYGAGIPLYIDKTEYHFYLYFKKDLLKYFAEKYFQSNFSESDLDDISRELANQIIGFAKNKLAEKSSSKFKLGTPESLGKVEAFPIKFEESHIFKANNRTFKIGYKKA